VDDDRATDTAPKPAEARDAESPPVPERGPDSVGSRLRVERERQRMSLRELARRLDLSASLISQVELGKATPSVGTLYAIVSELGMSLDELFFDGGSGASARGRATLGAVPPGEGDPPRVRTEADQLVVRRDARKSIQLDGGVRWERLTSVTESDLDFLYVTYDVGGESCAETSLMRHSGREYGHVISGRLGVTVGFDTHDLGPGDSIAFDSTVPHRLFNTGDVPVEGIWFVVGRGGDSRLPPLPHQQ
jgi:transcriptional regulator with XRE-family HTH domain